MDSVALITVILAGIACTQAGIYRSQTHKWNPWIHSGNTRSILYNNGGVSNWAGRQNGDDDIDDR